MRPTWRVLDTGLRPAAENIALNRALLESRQISDAPSTLRFLQFTPSALLGFHQSAAQELNLNYCEAQGIAVQRRITGGGAIYFDAGQLGWELYLHKREVGASEMQAITQRICRAAALGISALGVDAQFRPRNDIEVDGKKISGTGGCFDGDALLYQGSLLLDFDVEKMLKVLRIPAEKLAGKAIASVRERLTSLSDLLDATPALAAVQQALTQAFAETFNVDFAPASLSPVEQERYLVALLEIDSPEWVFQHTRPRAERPLLEAQQKFPAGLVRAALTYDARNAQLKQVCFSGDFFVTPRRAIVDLEAHLRDTSLSDLPKKIDAFFAQQAIDLMGLQPHNFLDVIQRALNTQLVTT